MSIFDKLAASLGNNKPQGQPVQQGQQNQQNNGQQNGQQPQPNNANGPAQPDNGMKPQQAAQSFEEMYKDIWKDDPKAAAGSGKMFNPDMANFSKVVEGMDFAGNVDPALQQKALAGDAEAMKQLLNSVGRNSFSRSALMASEMMNDGFTKKSTEFEKTMENKFKSLTARQNLAKNNPAFSSPEIRPLMESIETRLRSRFPEASAEDITQKAQEYLLGMAGKIHGGAQPKKETKVSKGTNPAFAGEDGEFDWLKYAGNGEEPAEAISPLS